MKRATFWSCMLTAFCALALFAVFSGLLIDYYTTKATQRELGRMASVYAEILESGMEYSQAVSYGTEPDLRVTVIGADGDVLADSNADLSGMENHADREEIEAALRGEPGFSVRKSATTGVRMMYYAAGVDTPAGRAVLRVAIPTSSIDGYVFSSIAVLCCLTVLVTAISAGVAARANRLALRPFELIRKGMRNVAGGTYAAIVPKFKDPELNETLSQINDFAAKIDATLAENAREKAKLNYILDSMGQGLAVVNGRNEIVLANRRAAEIFAADGELSGRSLMFLTRDAKILAAVERVLTEGTASGFDLAVGRRAYAVGVERLAMDWADQTGEPAAVITLRDVTEVREAERVRSEFFANASHELKTPLTTIKGFGELLANGMAAGAEKTAEYERRIVVDADRMLALIDDMLKLSHLEERERPQGGAVDLAEILAEAAEGLAVQAEQKGVRLSLETRLATVTADREHLLELVNNLADNAVKYNRSGGSVTLRAGREGDRPFLEVADTGIGIPEEHRARIFERFYRVDKGRSRKAGGTGLGLAIVKHIASLYGAEIRLDSREGEGTAIRVTFPLEK